MVIKDIAIVFDCGATNVRVIAINTEGQIIASESTPNETDEDPYLVGGRIWDLDKLWSKLCSCSKKVLKSIDSNKIAGVTFTTFGVDGTFVDEKGKPLYPVISWQCARTQSVVSRLGEFMPLKRLYEISSVYPYAFNTINKMIWMKENHPEIINSAYRFLFMPSLFINKLTGTMQNDTTMVGTSMMSDSRQREFSDEILESIGINRQLFGEIAEPGEKAGEISEKGALETGIPEGIPVYFTGHDTQFAVFGSGAELEQPVLSSGTWEVLMVRAKTSKAGEEELRQSLTTEFDAVKHVYDIGQNWLGSGVLEWFSDTFYPELSGKKLYETMIIEALSIETGEHGLTIMPDFFDDGTVNKGGSISGLTINTKRQEIYRALLESLAIRLREGLEAIESAGNFKAESIICVGGGARNRLWNQLRADAIQRPVKVINQKETTVLGASIFVFTGAGIFDSPEEAGKAVMQGSEIFLPKKQDEALWDQLFVKYLNNKLKNRSDA